MIGNANAIKKDVRKRFFSPDIAEAKNRSVFARLTRLQLGGKESD